MPKFNANLTMMFQEYEFFERFEVAAKAGFSAVEILFPYEHVAEDIYQSLTEHKLTVKLINAPAGDWSKGERGIAALPDRRAEFKQSVDKALYYAQALDCTRIHCMSGIVPHGLNRAECSVVYVDNLKYFGQKAAPLGIEILVEAINQVNIPNFLVNSQEQSLDIMQQVGLDNVKMQFDIYHCQMAQGSVATRLIKFLPHIGHIQIADVPGRHEPGTGEINYPFLFQHLDEIGYTGWVGCEYTPKNGTLAGLSWLKDVAGK